MQNPPFVFLDGLELKLLRESRQLSLMQLSRQSGVHEATLGRAEAYGTAAFTDLEAESLLSAQHSDPFAKLSTIDSRGPQAIARASDWSLPYQSMHPTLMWRINCLPWCWPRTTCIAPSAGMAFALSDSEARGGLRVPEMRNMAKKRIVLVLIARDERDRVELLHEIQAQFSVEEVELSLDSKSNAPEPPPIVNEQLEAKLLTRVSGELDQRDAQIAASRTSPPSAPPPTQRADLGSWTKRLVLLGWRFWAEVVEFAANATTLFK